MTSTLRCIVFFVSLASILASIRGQNLGSSCGGVALTAKNPSTWWVEQMTHNGLASFNPNPSAYQVFRNVKNYGAKGDGVTDDSDAINQAISDGGRCGYGCVSSTRHPALIYFPSGTYLINKPLIQYYYTQFVGDILHVPTILAAASFPESFMIETDPYDGRGNSWWTNQNQFFRQVRNFIFDTTRVTPSRAVKAIHWQVAQATSIINVSIKLSQQPGTRHVGIYGENGSGGYMSDITVTGGDIGISIGSQQFTSRNIRVSNARVGVMVNWDWAWTYKNLVIKNCSVGVDFTSGEVAGSMIVMDTLIQDTPTAILIHDNSSDIDPRFKTLGSLVIDNVELRNVKTGLLGVNFGTVFIDGTTTSKVIKSWGTGQLYSDTKNGGKKFKGDLPAPYKEPSLLNSQGYFFERDRPQYQEYDASDFINIKAEGARGDGVTDDTAVINRALAKYAGCKIIYFPAGYYIVTSTIFVPPGSRLTGEVWSGIMGTGSFFGNANAPQPIVQVGAPGDSGVAEFTDMLFTTKGSTPGAILVQWNIQDPSGQKGLAGMWDTHFRVGGAAGTGFTVDTCPSLSGFKQNCIAAFMLMHVTKTGSGYFENVWGWTSDHDMEILSQAQISIYNGRGLLMESQKATWLYGTAFEHNVLYQYNLVNAKNVFMTMIQTETPYYQPVPTALTPFDINSNYYDPAFGNCPVGSKTCAMSWGLRVNNAAGIYVYGAGLYNFFSNYNQSCLDTEDCQDAMVSIERLHDGGSGVYFYNLNTKAAVNMITNNGVSYATHAINKNWFCATIMGDLSHGGTGSPLPLEGVSTSTSKTSTSTPTPTSTSARTSTSTPTPTSTSASSSRTSTSTSTSRSSTSAAATTSTVPKCTVTCAGDTPDCCNNQCYNSATNQYSCPIDAVTQKPFLCPKGLLACNGACYDSKIYKCVNGGLGPL